MKTPKSTDQGHTLTDLTFSDLTNRPNCQKIIFTIMVGCQSRRHATARDSRLEIRILL